MRKHVLMFTTFAFILACGVAVLPKKPRICAATRVTA